MFYLSFAMSCCVCLGVSVICCVHPKLLRSANVVERYNARDVINTDYLELDGHDAVVLQSSFV